MVRSPRDSWLAASGAIAGLAAITLAAGYVGPVSSIASLDLSQHGETAYTQSARVLYSVRRLA